MMQALEHGERNVFVNLVNSMLVANVFWVWYHHRRIQNPLWLRNPIELHQVLIKPLININLPLRLQSVKNVFIRITNILYVEN